MTTTNAVLHHHGGQTPTPTPPEVGVGVAMSEPKIQISLHRRVSSLSTYQTTCISKHYALNNCILAGFESHYRNGLYTVAYHLGLKFVETALFEIPKHGYFYSDKHGALRLQSTTDALRVTHLLQEIIAKEPSFDLECDKMERLHYLAMKQFEHLGNYEIERKLVEDEISVKYGNAKRNTNRNGSSNLEPASSFTNQQQECLTSSLLACGDSFSSVFCPGANTQTTTTTTTTTTTNNNATTRVGEYKTAFPEEQDRNVHGNTNPHFPPTAVEQKQQQQQKQDQEQRQPSEQDDDDGLPLYPSKKSTPSLLDDDTSEEKSLSPLLSYEIGMGVGVGLMEGGPPPPLPPGPVRQNSDTDLQRALFLSGLQVDLQQQQQHHNRDPSMHSIPESDRSRQDQAPAPPGAKRRDSNLGVSMQMLTDYYHEDFDALRDTGRVIITQVPTWQGRVPNSTNGCTVIAPLLCIHHFHNEQFIPDPGLPDQIIVEVLDEETPNILPMVRKQLGLVQDAFLIPADAHEILMEQQYMCQEQFLSVCGGNIMEEEHLISLVKQLCEVGEKKLAATFFFHEHVITILQLRRSKDKDVIWFDIIDSLPHEETLLRTGETTMSLEAEEMEEDGGSTGTEEMMIHAKNSNNKDDSLRFSSVGLTEVDFLLVDYAPPPPPQAARMRCLDADALKATLRWYACSVFTDENRAYIDTYQWDDLLSDFDPRVFQAFIWTEI